jgi:hypothetical protein
LVRQRERKKAEQRRMDDGKRRPEKGYRRVVVVFYV